MIRVDATDGAKGAGLPRTRGDDPGSGIIYKENRKFAPHARG